jgi:hypothetical protein
LQITQESDLEVVADDRSELKRILKALEASRLLFTSPLDKMKKVIDAFFRSCRAPFEQADAIIDKKILGFREELRRAAAAEQERLRKEAEERHRREQEEWERQDKERRDREAREAKEREKAAKKGKTALPTPLPVAPPPPPPPIAPPAPVVPTPASTVGAMSFREEWDVEVVDFATLEDAHKLPNMTLLREMVKKRGVREIPGCRVFKREVSVTRT